MDPHEPRFSIIVPVYNTEAYVEACLRSALNQTEKSLEVIVVDDGSSDGSLALCESLAQADDRIRIFFQPNAGQGAARNVGLDNARGRFVVFLDSDDRLEPDLCAEVLPLMEEGVDFAGFGIDFVDENGAVRKPVAPYRVNRLEGAEIFASALLDRDVLTSPVTKVYRRQTLEDHAVRFPPLRTWEDSYFSRETARVSRLARFDNTVRYHALMRAGSTSRSIDSRKLKDALSLFEIERRAFARELEDPRIHTLFDAHIVKFLTHLLVLAALRTETRAEFQRCCEVAGEYGLEARVRDKAVMRELPLKVRIAALLAARPALLRAAAIMAGWLGQRPY